jgi:NAD+ diphosphatase
MPLTAFTNTFAGNPLDRASERRGDADWLADRLNDLDSLAIALWNGAPLVEPAPKTAENPQAGTGVRLAYFSAPLARDVAGGGEHLLFLGLWQDVAVFAVDFDGPSDPSEGPLRGLGRFEDLRGLASRLTAPEAAIAATAKGVFEWRRRHRHCSACGQPSDVVEGGWRRLCPACKTEHFPRTDPVVIMLPVQGERCLLGRQAAWPKGMWSALAGFLEPGESIEEACARELKEEADLNALSVAYHSSQPWPYPSSLMIGLIAEVAEGDATPDQTELEAVRWFTRTEVAQLLVGGIEGAFAPPSIAIAHTLIRAWAEGWMGAQSAS